MAKKPPPHPFLERGVAWLEILVGADALLLVAARVLSWFPPHFPHPERAALAALIVLFSAINVRRGLRRLRAPF